MVVIKRIISFFKSKQTSKSVESQNSDMLSFDGNPKDINLLIGDTILEIKIHQDHAGTNNWLDTSTTFIKLEKKMDTSVFHFREMNILKMFRPIKKLSLF